MPSDLGPARDRLSLVTPFLTACHEWLATLSLVTDLGGPMYDRRAADTLWLELRGALLAGVREHNGVGSQRILIDDARHFALRFQKGQRLLDVRASREVVTCTISFDADPDAREEIPIGLHPGSAPSFRLNGHPHLAETVAKKLLSALLQQES